MLSTLRSFGNMALIKTEAFASSCLSRVGYKTEGEHVAPNNTALNLASTKGADLYLYDPENGTTTELFIEKFKRSVKRDHVIEFENFNIKDLTRILPIVTIVRSTTERAEEDLDTALETIRDKDFPIIIIYIHMKKCSSISQTKTSLKGRGKYNDVLEIIDMDFKDKHLSEGRGILRTLKEVNKSAISRLIQVINDLTTGIKEMMNTVLVYKKTETSYSTEMIKELKGFMRGTLPIETIDQPCVDKPYLVICSLETLPDLLEELKDFDPSNCIVFCHSKQGDHEETTIFIGSAPTDQMFRVERYEESPFWITYKMSDTLLTFLHNCSMRLHTHRYRANQNYTLSPDLVTPQEPPSL